jgi:hypothetical protein
MAGRIRLESLNFELGICFGRRVMGGVLFRGGCLENKAIKLSSEPLSQCWLSL